MVTGSPTLRCLYGADGPNVILTAGLGMIFITDLNVICTTGLNVNFTAGRNVTFTVGLGVIFDASLNVIVASRRLSLTKTGKDFPSLLIYNMYYIHVLLYKT